MRRLHLIATVAAGILATTAHAAPGISPPAHQERAGDLACPAVPAPARFVKTVTVDVTVCVAPAPPPTPEPCPDGTTWVAAPDGKDKHAEEVTVVTSTTTSVVTVFVVPEAKVTPPPTPGPEEAGPECPAG
ncbi:hypothetical protein ISF_03725 [Cordyceps fumosorosea ARSEF 2679]|uniref:Uncharacterized protein n=1 Tax=Cordyceps fumosorosea (strain ARSEF 2679) TaxID=1081104 RepID=A0A167ZI72_CORFA|nr:hypothetical protein ISF_03725 [Cordyceps fumosorosea ARSEF 2679]OAA67549.1 hypothetical protein ISF_03725 [Cordyceps fumosorosea ARSEF 2679]